MQGKYTIYKKQYKKLYNCTNNLCGLLHLMKYFSPELNIAEIDSIIPAIEIAYKNAQDLLGILFDIEENTSNQNSTFV